MDRTAVHELDAVIAIARRGSFRRAALDMNMSTTALSNAIARLESSIGVRLFNRTTRSVSLTEAGRLFVDRVTPALQDIHDALDVARSQQRVPSGTLRINAFATAAREIQVPLVFEFLRRYPQVHVDLVTEGKLVDIVADGFDLGVRASDLVPSDMIAIPLGLPRRRVVVGSPAYLGAHGFPRIPDDLHQHQCIRVRLPNSALYRWHFEKSGEAVHIDVNGPMTLDEAGLARLAVLADVGLGYFMESDVEADIAAGHMVRVLSDWTPPFSDLSIYYPGRRNPSAALKAFIGLAHEFRRQSRAAEPSP